MRLIRLLAVLAPSVVPFPARAQPAVPDSLVARVADAVCDRQIVLLGELPSHGEARGFQAKAEIVRRLVDECGFDVLLFEAPMYDFVGFEAAMEQHSAVAAATLASRTPGLDMLDGRRNRDMRVAPAARGRGLGARLFRDVEALCRSMGLKQLLVEGQNVYAAACRFHERMGCALAAVEPAACPELPHEMQLLWLKTL